MSDHKKETELETPPALEEGALMEEEAAETMTVESLQAEIDRLKDQWLRAVADAENSRRRATREREEVQKFAIAGFARDILSVADNLRRALENCAQSPDLSESAKALIAGVEMTENELLSILDRQGVKKIDPLYEKFDPNFHQAMFEVETAEHEPGKVVQVLQHGYVIHERLLRPALVGVSKPVGDAPQKIDTMA